MQLFDQAFWWEIMMRHSDETFWWEFFMRPFDDILWWDFLVFQFFSFCLFSNTHSFNRYTVRLGNMTIYHKISHIFVLKVKISHKGEMGGRVGGGVMQSIQLFSKIRIKRWQNLFLCIGEFFIVYRNTSIMPGEQFQT